MLILKTLYLFITWGVMALAIAAIALIILRSIYNYADVNPFRRSAISLKRATDPMILPIRRLLVAFQARAKSSAVHRHPLDHPDWLFCSSSGE